VVCYCGGPAERSYRISLRVCDNEYNNCAFTCPTSESIQDEFFEFYESRSFLVALRRTIDFFVSRLLEIKAATSFAVRTRFVTQM